MSALHAAQVDADLVLQRGVDPVQEVLQQDIFRRDGGVGLQLEQEMPVRVLLRAQRRGRAVDRCGQAIVGSGGIHRGVYTADAKGSKPAVSDVLGQICADEAGGVAQGGAGLRQDRREDVPAMRQVGPGPQGRVDAGGFGPGDHTARIIQQDLAVAGLDQQRRQAGEVGIERRGEGVGRGVSAR